VSTAPSQPPTIAPDSISQMMGGMASMGRAGAALLDSLGNYQLDQAKILAIEVATEGDAQVVRAKRTAAKQYEQQARQLAQQSRRLRAKLVVVDLMQRKVGYLFLGDRIDHPLVSEAWDAWTYFYMMGPGQMRDALFAHLVPPEDAGQDQWTRGVRSANQSRAGEEAARAKTLDYPIAALNIARLAEWARKSNVVPATGSRAQQHFEHAITAMRDTADAFTARYKAMLDEAEKKVFTTYDPLRIFGLPSNTAISAAAPIVPNPIATSDTTA
jgi:hypothetical protein